MKYMNGFIHSRVKCLLFMYVVNDSGKNVTHMLLCRNVNSGLDL